MTDSGFSREREKVELLKGQLMVAGPQGSRHGVTVSLVADAVRVAFGRGWYVALDDESEPEPDVVVVPGTAREYRERASVKARY